MNSIKKEGKAEENAQRGGLKGRLTTWGKVNIKWAEKSSEKGAQGSEKYDGEG